VSEEHYTEIQSAARLLDRRDAHLKGKRAVQRIYSVRLIR